MANLSIALVDIHSRDAVISALRTALKAKTGRVWSVTGGRGTAYGWIRVHAPNARRTAEYVLVGKDEQGDDKYELTVTGRTGGQMTPDDLAVLKSVFGDYARADGISIPASSDYRREYLEIAYGLDVTKTATPYWD